MSNPLSCEICSRIGLPTLTGCTKCGNPKTTAEEIAELEANPITVEVDGNS
jgi:hypothetical protein